MNAIAPNYGAPVKNTYQLKRLKPKHEVILSLHMRGLTNKVIADHLNMTPEGISRVLHSPLVREHCTARLSDLDYRFINLKEKAIDAISDALDADQDIKTRVSAADIWLKANGYFEKKGDKSNNISLEDIVAKLVENGGGSLNVAVNSQERSDRPSLPANSISDNKSNSSDSSGISNTTISPQIIDGEFE